MSRSCRAQFMSATAQLNTRARTDRGTKARLSELPKPSWRCFSASRRFASRTSARFRTRPACRAEKRAPCVDNALGDVTRPPYELEAQGAGVSRRRELLSLSPTTAEHGVHRQHHENQDDNPAVSLNR